MYKFANNKKNKLTIITIVSIISLSIIGFIIGCSSNATKNNETTTNIQMMGPSYEMTIHEYIINEYFTRYDFSHYEETIKNNTQIMTKSGKFDVYLATIFIIPNMHLFTDVSLYVEIINDAEYQG